MTAADVSLQVFHYCQVAGVFVCSYFPSPPPVILPNTQSQPDIFLGYFGHHLVDVSPQQLVVDLKLSTFTQYPYALALGLARCSICMLLIRIFFIPRFKLAGHCMNNDAYLLIIAVWSVAVDVFIFALPIPMIWNLHLSHRRRIELSVVFGLWIIDIIISINRVVTVKRLDVEDLTWSGVSTALWAVAEPSVAILVACAPVYQVFFKNFSPKTLITRLYSKASPSTTHQELPDPPILDTRSTKSKGHYNSDPDTPPQLDELELGYMKTDQSAL
ncbi:MAG: hypothetical protein Q9167_003471 [Letrouitia subvulpina]